MAPYDGPHYQQNVAGQTGCPTPRNWLCACQIAWIQDNTERAKAAEQRAAQAEGERDAYQDLVRVAEERVFQVQQAARLAAGALDFAVETCMFGCVPERKRKSTDVCNACRKAYDALTALRAGGVTVSSKVAGVMEGGNGNG